MNALKIKKIFNNLYDKYCDSNEVITSTKGKVVFYPTKEERFEQIYVSSRNKTAKYTKFRSDISKCYFISESGTLLKLESENSIKLVENSDKKSDRRMYDITFKSLKKAKKIRDYHLIAFVFESNSTEQANLLLKKYGVKAFDYGLEVHHIRGLFYNDPNNLQIITEKEHKLLTRSVPSSNDRTISYLQNTSDIFAENTKPVIVLTDHVYDSQGNKLVHPENKYSEIKTISNLEDIEALENEIKGILENSYLPLSIVSYQDEICTLCLNKKSNDGILLDEDNHVIERMSLDKLKFYGFI